MTEFTVEVYGPRIESDDDWAAWRRATDVVPGTFLVEDPAEPCLVFPIEAGALNEAAVLVNGVMAALGLPICWGRAYLTEPDNGPHGVGSVVTPDFVPAWLEESATTQAVLANC